MKPQCDMPMAMGLLALAVVGGILGVNTLVRIVAWIAGWR